LSRNCLEGLKGDWKAGPWCIGEESKEIGGTTHGMDNCLPQARLCDGELSLVEVGKLGCICFSVMTSGLKGCTPVAVNAAFTASGVKARRYARPKTPAKSLSHTTTYVASKACIS